MTNIVKVFFLVIYTMASLAATASELTEESVKAIIAKADNAASTLNANGISNVMSKNAIIVMNINMKGKEHVLKPSKQEYIAMLQQGWSTYKNYKYTKSDVVIKIEGKKALVTANVKESMTVQGQNVSGESKEELTIELVNGKPLITKVIGYTSM